MTLQIILYLFFAVFMRLISLAVYIHIMTLYPLRVFVCVCVFTGSDVCFSFGHVEADVILDYVLCKLCVFALNYFIYLFNVWRSVRRHARD